MQPAVTMSFSFGTVEAFKAVSACFDFARLSQFHYAGPVSVAPSPDVDDCQGERTFPSDVEAKAAEADEEIASTLPATVTVVDCPPYLATTAENVGTEPAKRKRRTKAEMEAERAAKAAAALGAAPTPAPTPAPPAAAPVAPAPVAANLSQSVDIFGPPAATSSATPVVQPAAPVAAAGPPLAMAPADVAKLLRAECSRYLSAKSATDLSALYGSFGVKSLMELPLEKSSAFLAAIAAQIGPRT